MKQNRIKMPQLQFVSIVLLRSGFIPIKNLKSGRTFVNTVKIFENLSQNPNEIDVDSFLIHLFYQKSNYFISTRGKRARRVHQTPKISKNFTQEKFERHLEYLSQESEPGRDSKTLWLENLGFRCMKFYHVLTWKSCFCMRVYSQLSLKSNITFVFKGIIFELWFKAYEL